MASTKPRPRRANDRCSQRDRVRSTYANLACTVCGWPIPCSEGALAHGIADLDPDGLAEAPEITDYVCRIHICQALAEFARNHGIQRRG